METNYIKYEKFKSLVKKVIKVEVSNTSLSELARSTRIK